MEEKALATEVTDPQEEKHIQDVVNVLSKSLKKEYGRGRYYRRFHAKSVALLEADFTVAENLPAHLRVGLFELPKTYKAWVRFSNASYHVEPDYNKSVRGMSIKILNAGATPLELDALGQTQDFLLTNNPILYPGTATGQRWSQYVLFANKLYFFIVLFIAGLRGLFTFLKSEVRLSNFLNASYYSATPFLFGEGQAVKWRATKAKLFQTPMPNSPDENFLRTRLAEILSKESATFELSIQLQHHPETEPVEDASVEWKTPFQKVATLTLLQQDFNTAERTELEEKITFSPWHCRPEHRPLGSANRLRRAVYRVLAAHRQQHNRAPL